jgi:hypothetical protein
MFSEKAKHVAYNLGFGDSLGGDYFTTGVGFRYFAWTGVEVDVDFDLWLGDTPLNYNVSTGLRYVFHQYRTFIPYVGAYAGYHYIESMPNLSEIGARAGLYTALGNRSLIGYGLAFGTLNDCETTTYMDCSVTKLEFTFSLPF